MKSRSYTLKEIADFLGAEVHGDESLIISGLSTLKNASATDLTFLANPKYAKDLGETAAGAVLISAEALDRCHTNALVLANPYLGYAKISHWFAPAESFPEGVHPSATVALSAVIQAGASVGAYAVIAEGVTIGADAIVGSGCSVGMGSQIGERTRLAPRATVYPNVTIGQECLIHSGAVIGSDGFGFAQHQGEWIKIAQLGGVVIGNKVEIGANTTIDSGALEPTRIGNGVIIDNQVQIAHNVQIGDGTAIAGCVGIAGSAVIGRYCSLGGGVGVAGHLEISDHVHITGMSLVSASISKPGVYSSGTALTTNKEWRKNVARFRNLDDLARRLIRLEKEVSSASNNEGSVDDGN
ncbi:UDP-3-O-(3-hydroxymyristoyl)glucosamine N-acyltransferase [Pokkaliibacter sp. CJK22405]|uniref:UDP-3-O-(3-hydroxymyristoyl)glucosamine N-acyltransferase n=1 Tax=Pokkaliibacter sp. CJK22405 TaxID=3384615 RepID=UPI003984FCB6